MAEDSFQAYDSSYIPKKQICSVDSIDLNSDSEWLNPQILTKN